MIITYEFRIFNWWVYCIRISSLTVLWFPNSHENDNKSWNKFDQGSTLLKFLQQSKISKSTKRLCHLSLHSRNRAKLLDFWRFPQWKSLLSCVIWSRVVVKLYPNWRVCAFFVVDMQPRQTQVDPNVEDGIIYTLKILRLCRCRIENDFRHSYSYTNFGRSKDFKALFYPMNYGSYSFTNEFRWKWCVNNEMGMCALLRWCL